MGIAGHTPNFTAAGTILPFSCVKSDTTDPFKVLVATVEDDVVLGVTDGSTRRFGSTDHAIAGDPVVLQNSEFLQLRAGGTIAIGDGLRPNANGSVVKATDRVQFVACDSAVSGEIFWAQRVGSVENTATINGFYGNNRAAAFLRDAINGTDSVDIITIGDSNAGQNDYGYTNGVDRCMAYFHGATMYATPLLSQGNYYQGVTSTSFIVADNMVGTGNFLFTGYVDPATGGSTTGYTGAVGSTRLMGYFTGDANIDALKNHLNINTTIINNNNTCTVAQPNRWMALPCCVATAATFAGNGTTNYVRLRDYNPMFFGGAADLQYRLVYGTFAAGSGQFKLRASNGSSTTYAISSNFTSTNTGALGYATASLNFNVSAQVFCTWDGGASPGANLCTGPFAALWGSIIKTATKGYSVTNFTTSDGRSTAQIYAILGNMDKMVDAFLKEIRERQVAAGGSGRTIVWLNSGINGAETGTTWTTNAALIRDLIAARWVSTGGNLNNLAFIMSVSHPVVSYGSWATDRPAISAAANAWATANANDGKGVCVVDIAVRYPAAKLASGSNPYNATNGYFDSGGQQHLQASYSTVASSITRGNGYDAVAGAVINSVLATI